MSGKLTPPHDTGKEGNRYGITPRGAYYYHYFENYYTLSYIDQMWHLLRNEAFPERLLIR